MERHNMLCYNNLSKNSNLSTQWVELKLSDEKMQTLIIQIHQIIIQTDYFHSKLWSMLSVTIVSSLVKKQSMLLKQKYCT